MKKTHGFRLAALAALPFAFSMGAVQAQTVDVLDPNIGNSDAGPFYAGHGATVNTLSASFSASDIAGANLLVLNDATSYSASQLTALTNYVDGGGRVLLNSEWSPGFQYGINSANAVLAALGSTIVNNSSANGVGYETTTNIASNAFTAGVTSIVYADSSDLSNGSGGTTLFTGLEGQEFAAFQQIGSGYVFVVADSNVGDVNGLDNAGNQQFYLNLLNANVGGGGNPSVPEPATLTLLGVALLGIGATRKRKAV